MLRDPLLRDKDRLQREYHAKMLMRVELFTDTYRILGDVEVSRWRLTDVLNDPQEPLLLMENVSSIPLPAVTSRGQARTASYYQISKSCILMAIPHETDAMESARQQYLAALVVEKVPMRALVALPPFEIEGLLHLRKFFQVQQALRELSAEFIPITDALLSYLPDDTLQAKPKVIIVNRPKAQIFYLAPAESEEDQDATIML